MGKRFSLVLDDKQQSVVDEIARLHQKTLNGQRPVAPTRIIAAALTTGLSRDLATLRRLAGLADRYAERESHHSAEQPRDLTTPPNVHETRRRNLRAIIDSRFKGNSAQAAKAFGFSQTPFIYTLLAASGKARRNIGNKLARKIERAAGKPINWLDNPAS